MLFAILTHNEMPRLRFGSCRPGKLPEKWFPKLVRRGCKRSFGPREQEASCTGAKWGCTGAKEGLGGAKDSWETFAPWAHQSQKNLFHPPLTTFGDFPFLGNFPGPQHPKTKDETMSIIIRRMKTPLETKAVLRPVNVTTDNKD